MNKQLQLAIFNEMKNKELTTQEKIVVSCILYVQAANLLELNKSLKSTVSSVLSSYSGNITSKVQSLKGNYLSYDLMLKEVEKINKNSFYQYTDDDLNAIYALYLSKTKLKKFSSGSFSQSAYKIENLSYNDDLKLQKIHKYIMVPICNYFKEYFNIQDSDLEIYSVQDTPDSVIGNEIIFSIKGLSPSRIVSVINSNKLALDIYSAEVYKNMVKILIK